MSAESVAVIPRCAECDARWLPADEERWQAHLGGDDLDEPPDVVFYCPQCAEREIRGQEPPGARTRPNRTR